MSVWYDNYLKSDHWQRTRILKLLKADIDEQWQLIRCERKDCGLYVPLTALDIHHLHYRTVGHEALEDLAVYCRSCHGVTHGFEPRLWWLEAKRGKATMVFSQQINRDRHLKRIGDIMLECLAYMEEYMPALHQK